MNENTIYLIKIVVLVIVAVSLALQITYCAVSGYVKKRSTRYKYVLSLLKSLSPETLELQYKYRYNLKSKAQLDRLNVDTQMMNLIASNTPPMELIKKAQYNRQKLLEYRERVKTAPPFRKPEHGLYYSVEKMLISTLEKREAPVIPSFLISFCYTSPQGRNRYRVNYTFSLDHILGYCRRIKDAEKYRQSAQYQRSIMTDSLRYDVMKRDRFHCVICGSGAEDGVRLHVDHIVPVSKGGKTEMSNLRTLCERCNLGKRDKYDPSGNN